MVSQIKPLSNICRIQRLLELKLFSNTTLERTIVNALPRQKKYTLTMDRTAWELGKRDYNIMAIGICYDGISIHICFDTYDKDGTSDFTEEIAFIEQVIDIIPIEAIKCPIADREFGNSNFIRWLKICSIPFCLRLSENFNIRIAGTKQIIQIRHNLAWLPLVETTILSNTYIVTRKLGSEYSQPSVRDD